MTLGRIFVAERQNIGMATSSKNYQEKIALADTQEYMTDDDTQSMYSTALVQPSTWAKMMSLQNSAVKGEKKFPENSFVYILKCENFRSEVECHHLWTRSFQQRECRYLRVHTRHLPDQISGAHLEMSLHHRARELVVRHG